MSTHPQESRTEMEDSGSRLKSLRKMPDRESRQYARWCVAARQHTLCLYTTRPDDFEIEEAAIAAPVDHRQKAFKGNAPIARNRTTWKAPNLPRHSR